MATPGKEALRKERAEVSMQSRHSRTWDYRNHLFLAVLMPQGDERESKEVILIIDRFKLADSPAIYFPLGAHRALRKNYGIKTATGTGDIWT